MVRLLFAGVLQVRRVNQLDVPCIPKYSSFDVRAIVIHGIEYVACTSRSFIFLLISNGRFTSDTSKRSIVRQPGDLFSGEIPEKDKRSMIVATSPNKIARNRRSAHVIVVKSIVPFSSLTYPWLSRTHLTRSLISTSLQAVRFVFVPTPCHFPWFPAVNYSNHTTA